MNEILNLAERYVADLQNQAKDKGRPLTNLEKTWALESGVQSPDLIRLIEVDWIEKPRERPLAQLLEVVGLLDSLTLGLTLDNLVLIKKGYYSERLLRHEFRHVHQWGQYPSKRSYIEEYLKQISTFGYQAAPFEVDARAYESPNIFRSSESNTDEFNI